VKALASPTVRLETASAGYAPDTPVLSKLDLRLDHDDRIGLLGANGNGKSTFAKLIAGRLTPLSGRRLASEKMIVGFFAQHQMDDLPERMTPFQHMTERMPEASEAQRRARLGAIGFGADKADTRAENLSGGEKARLLLALAAFHQPHLLILDEPTNHLDVDSREALVRALTDYQGAVILISHDRHLIEASCDRLWLVRDGTVKPYDGDMDSYRELLLSERGGAAGSQREPSPDVAGQSPASRAELRRIAAERRAELAPLKRQLQAHEKRLDQLGAQIAAIDAKLGDAELYARAPDKAQALVVERGQLHKSLTEAEESWLQISLSYETAMANSD